MTVRESSDELTLRADEVGTGNSVLMSTTLQKGGGVPLLIGTPSAKRHSKASKEKIVEICMVPTMSRAVG